MRSAGQAALLTLMDSKKQQVPFDREGHEFLNTWFARNIELPVDTLENFHKEHLLNDWQAKGRSLEKRVSFVFHGTSKTALAAIVAGGGVMHNLKRDDNPYGTSQTHHRHAY